MGDSDGSSFFGLIVKPDKRYESSLMESFRITKACLEPATAGDKVTSLYAEYNNEEFIIANLDKRHLSEPLDLGFRMGEEKVAFKVAGPGTVHITGNIIDDEPDMMDMMDDEDDSDTELDTTAEVEQAKSAKRKQLQNGVGSKKIKLNDKTESSDDDDDDDEDDMSSDEDDTEVDTTRGDLDSTNNFAEEEDSDDDDDSDAEDDEDDDEDDEDDDDEEDDSDDDEEEEEEEKKEALTKVLNKSLNGAAKQTPTKEGKQKADALVKTPKAADKQNKLNTPKPEPKSPKQDPKTPKQDGKTPKKEAKTPKQDPKTPKQDPKTPKQDPKTPKQDPKTPKQDAKTPKQDPKTPKQDAKTPKQDPKTPKQDPKTPKQDPKTPKQDPKSPKQDPKTPKNVMKGGVSIEEVKVGSGPEAKKGSHIGMYYTGRLKSNNKQFDACQSGKPFKFRLGAGEVIKGWDVGVLGMKVGGKRRLTIPANMAYGAKGAMPDIPGNSTLVFDVECKFAN